MPAEPWKRFPNISILNDLGHLITLNVPSCMGWKIRIHQTTSKHGGPHRHWRVLSLTQWASQKAQAPDSYRIYIHLNVVPLFGIKLCAKQQWFHVHPNETLDGDSEFLPRNRDAWHGGARGVRQGQLTHARVTSWWQRVSSLRSDYHPCISHLSHATNRSARCNER